ncbi:MAG: PLP-dependent aminotransferase family protein [Chloroflexota bacterium]
MPLPPLRLDPASRAPRYLQLAEALAAAIADGTLADGERLPSERDLAATLGLSRTTVVTAYRELEARGLVRGFVGRGTFVCAADEPADAPFAWRGRVALGAQRALDPILRGILGTAGSDLISFGAGMPAPELFPVDLFSEVSERVLRRDPVAAFGIGPTEGQPDLRMAVAARLKVRPDQVLVVAGSQQGLDLIARCLLDAGDTVLIDRPGYLGAIQTFRSAGANLVGWDIERADPDELEDLIVRYRPKLLYLGPTFQNPTGRTLPLDTRHELLRVAARYRLPIVEDDPYSALWFDRPPPASLLALDERGLVIYLGTASKTLGVGLRLGWLVAPPPIVEQLSLVKARSDLFTNGQSQLVLAEILGSRAFDDYVARLRAEHAARQNALASALRRHLPAGVLTWRPVEGGQYLWCRVRGQVDTTDLLQRAQAAGVTFVPGEAFYADGLGRHELRMCFSGVPPARIEEGAHRLAKVLAVSQERPAAGRRALV